MPPGESETESAAQKSRETVGGAADERRVGISAAAVPPRWALILGMVAFLFVGVAAIAIYAYTAQAVGDRDPFLYAEVGKEILAGRTLYRDTWIDKPPVGLWMYAVPQLFVPRSYRAIVVFCAGIIVAQGLLFALAFRASLPAAAAAALFTIFYPLQIGTFCWPSTEHFANLFVTGCLVIALAIARRRDFTSWQCVAAGALAMLAFHVRQNTVLCGLPPLLTLALADRPPQDRLRGAAWMVVGGLLSWGAVLVGILLSGDWDGYWWLMLKHPPIFASLGSFEELVMLLIYFGNSLLVVVLVIFGLLAAQGRYRWLALAAAVIGPGSCLLTFHNHPHYLVNSLPYLALLIGLGTEGLSELAGGAAWLAPAAMTGLTLLASTGRMRIAAAEPTLEPLVHIAAETDRLAPDDATLWVCGPQPSEAIQFTSRLLPANRHCWVFQMRSPWKQLMPKPWETILAEYMDHPPDVLVVHQGIEREAQAAPSPRAEPEYLQLLRMLLTRFHYRSAAVVEGYSILLRNP